MGQDDRDYALAGSAVDREIEAPKLPYRPPIPASYNPPIGLIGCGGITEYHLKAYRSAGFRVVALTDLVAERAEERRTAFYPDAKVCRDYREVLDIDEIEVVDVATHPIERVPIIEESLRAGKHVLSQKPFVIDLDTGERLVKLAAEQKRHLAVNQNGRWAPHFSYLRLAVDAGVIGDVFTAHCDVHWDHDWVADTPFNSIPHVILYDFAVHWFDMLHCFLRHRKPLRVYASNARAAHQKATPPLLGQAIVEYEGGQASLCFDGAVKHGARDRTYLAGSEGTLLSEGPNLSEQEVTLQNAEGWAKPKLEGTWFAEGFLGTMSELLAAIEAGREPANAASDNLGGLAMCFAACASAERGEPCVPGEVRRMPGK